MLKTVHYKKLYLWYIAISVIFVILNIMTFEWKLAWNDETELTDTPANFVEFGEWISRAYPDYGGKEPFSVYVPLHQMLLALWMKIFGFSMVTARSFNLLLTFATGWSFLLFVKRMIQKEISIITIIVFTLLFWGCAEFALIYRNGRGDMLGVLICSLLAINIFDYLHSPKQSLLYVTGLLSGILIWSALQSCIFAAVALLFLYFAYKKYRHEIIRVVIYMIVGFIVGFLLLMLFFLYNDHLFPFLVSIASLSGSLKSIAALLLPYLGPPMGLNPDEWLAKLADDEIGPSFVEKILSIYSFITYDVLLAVSLVVLWTEKESVKRYGWKKHPVVLLLLFVVLVPFFMNLAGRFVPYYRWMTYLPLVLVLIVSCELFTPKRVKYGVLAISLIISSYGINSLFDVEQKKKNDAIKELCQRVAIEKKDLVCAPDEFFYEIRKKSNYCYFTKHYPVRYLNIHDIDFYIKNLNDFATSHNTKFSRQLQKALDDEKSISLIPVDSCATLNVVVYKVNHSLQN